MQISKQDLNTAAAAKSPIAWFTGGLIAVGLAACIGAVSAAWSRPIEPSPQRLGDQSDLSIAPASDRLFPVIIRNPAGPPRVYTGIADAHGNAITVSCATCHATRPADATNTTASDLTEFHAGMHVSHGSISCLACHNPDDYDSLRLADGSRVEFTDVMTLCAQCHGQQARDYSHGAHGGMTGFWDRTRGPQNKLHCVDCHHPHAPQFPKMHPTFKPFDRFLSPPEGAH